MLVRRRRRRGGAQVDFVQCSIKRPQPLFLVFRLINYTAETLTDICLCPLVVVVVVVVARFALQLFLVELEKCTVRIEFALPPSVVRSVSFIH